LEVLRIAAYIQWAWHNHYFDYELILKKRAGKSLDAMIKKPLSLPSFGSKTKRERR